MITTEGLTRSYDTEADRIARARVTFPEVRWVVLIGLAVLVGLFLGRL